jgi:flagellar L-ring protein precursor FlgH
MTVRRLSPAMWLPFLLLVILVLQIASAHGAKVSPKAGAPTGATEKALAEYISRVQQESAAEPHSAGSIWSDDGAFTRLSSDVRAIHVHDLVSIVVVETLSASTDGSVKNARSSNASSQVAALFGKLSASNSLQNLLSQNSASGLTAQGQSVTNSSLNTVVGGQVMNVLPNGVLVIEAERQVAFNQQTQLIRLRGLVRPSDVNVTNQVLSTAVTDLELEVVGKGIINDYTYRQNPLVRLLERLVIF